MSLETTLIVQCSNGDRRVMIDTLAAEGREVHAVEEMDAAGQFLASYPCDLMILDVELLHGSQRHEVKHLRSMLPQLPVLLVGPERDAATFAAALTISACGYMHSPIAADQLLMFVEQFDEHTRLLEENRYLWDELERAYGCDGLIASDPEMVEVLRQATCVAGTDTAVLIHGEEGTERELVAQYIHRSSSEQPGPFIRLNCRSISPEQCARELFGAEDAGGKHPGRIDLAAGGTLYLEEAAELPLALQARLLRVIEDGVYQREGGAQTIKGAVRVIASTSSDPYEQIRRGELREDLFFRLNIVPIFLPPLRKRPGDIPALADHFARKFGSDRGAAELLGDERLAEFETYQWPGNVSELEGEMLLAALRNQREPKS